MQYPFGNVDFLLAAAKVVTQRGRRVESQVFANEIPSCLQILGASGKLEVVDVHAEE
jgi:hypothetical protein